jgi:putative tryptophan/tyrosine transport system substrate-binding protein
MWAVNFDPIARGYVKSLARPGGNITGVVSLQTELAAKQVELLTQAFPERTRLAVLWDGISADQFAAAERQARSLRLDVRSLKLENPPYDFDAAFRSLAEGSPQMLLVLSSPFFTVFRSRITKLAIQQRLPTMFIFKLYAEAEGLISYGVDPPAIYRQLDFYAGKILNERTSWAMAEPQSLTQHSTACYLAASRGENLVQTGMDAWCCHRSQDAIVLTRSIDTVMGPTPPGTGVI